MSTETVPIDRPDLANLPKSSLVRLYDPQTHGNSFALDGFPALKPGISWKRRLVDLVEQWGFLNMTTNQTIFRQWVETGVLDEPLRDLKAKGLSVEEIYTALYNEAALQAARAFEGIHARWPWEGRVSQEASARLTQLEPLVREVRRIAGAMRGVGAFTKIPNLPIGPQAIEQALGAEEVIHPNITLVFSDLHYLQTVEGTLRGLQSRTSRGDLSQIHSVNSLFVSRVDRVVDPMIDEALSKASSEGERKTLRLLKGKTAVAQAKKVYRLFESIFLGKPTQDPQVQRLSGLFSSLKKQGANPQRLLIASSGVKADQPYSPLLYVLPFLGPWCANTLPEATLEAFSHFVARMNDAEAAVWKGRNLMSEPLPAIPTDVQPTGEWDQALLRGGSGLDPEWVLTQVHELVLKPKGTSLRVLCDTLRDKGAASFLADEQATLQVIRSAFQNFPRPLRPARLTRGSERRS